MIKRSVPNTFLVRCPTLDYARGVATGVHEALNCLTHECDIIMRTNVEISTLPKAHEEHDQEYAVRARFTVREKQKGATRGQVIYINKAYLEEEISDNFDIGKEWKGLSDDEMFDMYAKHYHEGKKFSLGRLVEATLKEKNK
jgi:hypothetical protein